MDANERILLRQWSKLSFRDPEELLREIRRFELRLPGTRLRRTNALKRHLERRQAALFAYGLGLRLRTRVLLADAPAEALDYDFALVFQIGDERHHWPLQVKELVPADINPTATLTALLAKLSKYGIAPRLCVAVYVNRRVPASSLSVSPLTIGSLWLFGGADDSGHRWNLQGDFMQPDCRVTYFHYPEPKIIVP